MVVIAKDEPANNRCNEKDYRNTASETKTIERGSLPTSVFMCNFDRGVAQLLVLLDPGIGTSNRAAKREEKIPSPSGWRWHITFGKIMQYFCEHTNLISVMESIELRCRTLAFNKR